jgi:hypothetical protein
VSNAGWHYLRAAPSVGIEEQWILRIGPAPACSLKQAGIGQWRVSLMNLSGISAVQMELKASSLVAAKTACELELLAMGWQVLSKEGQGNV